MAVPIEITILGSGSAIPTLKRKHPAILLKYEGDYMLFDCGECAQLALQRAKVSPLKIRRVFITHWHADHFAGLIPLIETMHMLGRKDALEIYAPEAEWFVEKIMDLSYWRFGFGIRGMSVSLEEVQKIVEEKHYEIYSIPVRHSVPAVGYIFREKDHWKIIPSRLKKFGIKGERVQELKEKRVLKVSGKIVRIEDVAKMVEGRKIAYSGDTLAFEEFFKACENAELVIHDATFLEPEKGRMHACIKEVCEYAKKYGIKKLVLTHFSKRYRDEKTLRKTAKSFFPSSLLARDGLKIVVK